MIVFPNAKINIGLNIVEKREDGYHNLESVFLPIGWKDALEVIIDKNNSNGSVSFSSSGLAIPGDTNDNLCIKAYRIIQQDYDLPAIKIHLHKNIPMGAGLGGGSSDAAFCIKAINEVCELNLAWGEMHHYAKQLGSDCSFFITNKPAYATQKGDVLESISVNLSGKHLLIVHPGIHVSTAQAYAGVTPLKPICNLEEIILNEPIESWKEKVKNDFEKSVFEQHSEIKLIKDKMYENGAVYASMSGSGSAVYGIFNNEPTIAFNSAYAIFKEKIM
jgi:4-diphosphocytidyl-2-C-methyl-D-erythritol kinase